jgi:hypothetical protein
MDFTCFAPTVNLGEGVYFTVQYLYSKAGSRNKSAANFYPKSPMNNPLADNNLTDCRYFNSVFSGFKGTLTQKKCVNEDFYVERKNILESVAFKRMIIFL